MKWDIYYPLFLVLGVLVKLIRGFTLIELMVTIAVMAIIATIAAPSFLNMIEKQRLNQDTQNLISQLSKARSQAVLLRKDVTLTLNSSDTDTSTAFNWAMSGEKNQLTSSISAVTFSSTGIATNLVADAQFSICNKRLNVTRIFVLGRFGTVMMMPNGVC